MENPTPLDVNEAIRRWRVAVGATPALGADDLDELESHLRDSMADLEGRGLSGREAFQVASGRLGSPESLGAEFDKVHWERQWLNRGLWMVSGVLVAELVSGVFQGAGLAAALVGGWLAWHGSALGALAAAAPWAALFLTMVLAWICRQRRWTLWSRLGARAAKHPLGTAALVLTLQLVATASLLGAHALLTRTVAMADYGTVFLWQRSSHLLFPILVWPGLLGWLLLCRANNSRVTP